MDLVPSILSTYLTDFRLKIEEASRFAPRIQVDFVDGKFASNLTITADEAIAEIENYKEKTYFEAHLMVERPEEWAYKLAKGGFKKIILQVESEGAIRDILTETLILGASCGLALAPETPASFAEPFIDLLDTILILSVPPGRSGQRFIPSTLLKIGVIKDFTCDLEIEVDGGVNEETISELIARQADTAVVGSFIFDEGLPEVQFNKLRGVV